MHWWLGLVGALIGVALADERSVLGAVVGFLIAFLLAGQQRLRRQVELLGADVARLRARQAAGQVAANASGAFTTRNFRGDAAACRSRGIGVS